ncbi:MAG: hypothetical protein JWN86_2477 [Planctomycetota bacterium]|nr:hypothetical protein [Planctomycetota bacterium]
MFLALLCSALIAADAPATGPSPDNVVALRAAELKVGRDADSHVRLALWCEAHGMSAERMKHLAMAVMADPSHATARGLMGLVRDDGKWRRPDDVVDRTRNDEEQTKLLTEYTAIRDKTPSTADAQWKLSVWCDKHGLKPQAEGHARTVLRIDPSRRAAWERLGCKNVGGRWLTEAQILAERREANAQLMADRKWLPRLGNWRNDLRDRGRRGSAETALAAVTDPRAVPSIVRVFSTNDPADQERLVQILGQIDGGPASRLLATAALYGDSSEVRRAATETLTKRDPRDFVAIVIAQIRDLLKYEIKPVAGPGSQGVLLVEGKNAIVRRRYSPPTLPEVTKREMSLRDSGVIIGPLNAIPADEIRFRMILRDIQIANDLAEVDRAAVSAQMQLQRDVATLENANAIARSVNDRSIAVLTNCTEGTLGEDREAWAKWWTERQGYAFVSPPQASFKPVIDQDATLQYQPQFITTPLRTTHSCFAAGTAVRTRDGMKSIETLKLGDLVLAQDVTDGRLGFEPIIAVYHNPPAPTFEIRLHDDVIVATGIHRFWLVGKGWAMARDLRPGDIVRTVGGTDRVKSVEPRKIQPVFNLEVARSHGFFVGLNGTLVHDNSLVETTPEPFDRLIQP